MNSVSSKCTSTEKLLLVNVDIFPDYETKLDEKLPNKQPEIKVWGIWKQYF